MTKGNCDPGPGNFNETTVSKANGQVTITVRSSWDGVSVFPNCAGPIEDAHVVNASAATWYAHFARKRGGVRTVSIAPGDDRTVTAAQLAAVGLDTLADIQAVRLTASPTPPA
jgi:hypothetical protein